MTLVPRSSTRRASALFLASVLCAAAPASAESLAIVVAKDVAVDSLSSDELAKIFRCEETSGPNGVSWQIFTRERTAAERNLVLKEIYHMTEAQYNRFFMQAVFAGKLADAPRVIPSPVAMKSIAATRPGAVTYILASQVDSTVKALKIDGLSPGDPKYPLKLAD